VGPGWLAARDVAELARLLDQVLLRTGQALSRTMPRRRRPNAADIEKLCRPYLVSWNAGSAVAGFNFVAPLPIMENLRRFAENSLCAFLTGLAEIASDDSPEPRCPRGFDRRVLETCARFGKLLEHGIGAVRFGGPPAMQAPTVTYNERLRERVTMLASREQVPAHSLQGEFFGDEGKLQSRATLAAEHPSSAFESSFWKSTSLEQLAAEQGVRPIADIAELNAMFPAGDVFDDVLSDLLEDRDERRRLTRRRSQ
jgi:hypothetical protein